MKTISIVIDICCTYRGSAIAMMWSAHHFRWAFHLRHGGKTKEAGQCLPCTSCRCHWTRHRNRVRYVTTISLQKAGLCHGLLQKKRNNTRKLPPLDWPQAGQATRDRQTLARARPARPAGWPCDCLGVGQSTVLSSRTRRVNWDRDARRRHIYYVCHTYDTVGILSFGCRRAGRRSIYIFN